MPNALATLMHHPALAGPFLAYNNVLLQSPDARARATASSWSCASRGAPGPRYEWAQHVRTRGTASASPRRRSRRSRTAPAPARWTRSKPTCSRAADQLDRPLPRSTTTPGAAWPKQLDERQLVELVFVVGTYTALAMAFNSFGLQLDPELREIAIPPLPELEE